MKNVDMTRISAVVLAAGQSKRMGQNKLLMPVNGKPILMHTLDLTRNLDFGERILVTSKETAAGIDLPEGFVTVINESPEKGQSSSLKLGVKAASLDYYMFFLADMPMLQKSDVQMIISEICGDKIIVPMATNTPSNPVIFPKSFREALLALEGDIGGRGLIAVHKNECKHVFFKKPENFRDIDIFNEYQNY